MKLDVSLGTCLLMSPWQASTAILTAVGSGWMSTTCRVEAVARAASSRGDTSTSTNIATQ